MKQILEVKFNEENGQYLVNCDKDTTVNEVFFAMTVVIKCFEQSKLIEKRSDALDILNRYLYDPQFEAIEEKTEQSEPQVEQLKIDEGVDNEQPKS